jgi:hypothetical protein
MQEDLEEGQGDSKWEIHGTEMQGGPWEILEDLEKVQGDSKWEV